MKPKTQQLFGHFEAARAALTTARDHHAAAALAYVRALLAEYGVPQRELDQLRVVPAEGCVEGTYEVRGRGNAYIGQLDKTSLMEWGVTYMRAAQVAQQVRQVLKEAKLGRDTPEVTVRIYDDMASGWPLAVVTIETE